MQTKLPKCSSTQIVHIICLILLYNFAKICPLNAVEQIAHQKADLDTLKFVHVLWRHGVRTPTIEMAKEQREWKQGLGELTTKGMGQLYRLGQWIRRRYDGGFISSDFNNFEMYVRSSDFNRTLMSAQALLAGLYPPRADREFEPGLNWQPIPVHTESREIDQVIFDGSNCESMTAEEQQVFNRAEVAAIERENADFLRFLAIQSGYEKVPLPLREMHYVFDPLICIKLNGEGKELPKWASDSVIERVWRLHDISAAFSYNTTRLVRFHAGVLFTEILQRMKSVQRGFGANYDVRQRVQAYSAHDTTLAGVLNAFGLRSLPFPHFATALFIELHQHHHTQQQQSQKKKEKQLFPHFSSSAPLPSGPTPYYFVRLFYRNETDVDTLWELTIPDCPFPCTVDRLEQTRAAILTTKEEQKTECAAGASAAKFVWSEKINTIASRHREHIYIILICVLSLLSVSMFLYIMCCSVARSHRRKVFSLESNEKAMEAAENEMGKCWRYSLNRRNSNKTVGTAPVAIRRNGSSDQ